MFIIVVPLIGLVFLLFLIMCSTLCVLYYKSHYKKDPIQRTVDTPVSPCYYTLMQSPLKALEQYDIEYDYSMLHIENKIGEGEFGVVYKARAPGLKCGDWEVSADEFVAIKMLKTDADLKIVLDFVKEVDTVVNFEHENVIRLLGICTEQLD